MYVYPILYTHVQVYTCASLHVEYIQVCADMKKSAGTAVVPGEHFGWLGNILDQNFRCFVAL